jgi:NodT family efflux transporter outer membrane factor (OMF) lipoprotein
MPTKHVSFFASLLLLFMLLFTASGCMVGPNYKPPKLAMPQAWAPPTTAPTTQDSVTTTASAEMTTWWGTLRDPVLNSLVDRAIESNLDLKQAESRIRQARASRGVTGAALWPTANTTGSYSRVGSGGTSSVRFVGPGGTISDSGGSASSRDLFRAGLDASWELDLFGGVRRDIEAANADLRAAIEDRRDVLVTLTSELALDYVDLRGFQRQIVIARQNLKSQQHSADLTRRRRAGGFVSGLDVANADATVATTRAQIPLLEQNARQAIYSIALLLGREPAALVEELSAEAPIPSIPSAVPVELPSDLLRRRPDIRRAEEQIHASTARVGVATADLFPRFSLTGSMGTQGNQLQSLANWNNGSWSIGPGVSWPIFSAGSIRANIRVQNALQEQAAIRYEQAVLTALRDVESALVAFAQEQEHRKALTEAVTANRTAVDLSQRLYTQGQTDFLNVLSAQRSLYASEDALVQSDRTVATNLVALYKALGGGW